MSLFDDVKPLSDIADGRAFFLLDYTIKRKNTVYGEKDQFVLKIAWDEDGTVEYYSGYSAGILAQLGNSSRSDFPAWVKLETSPASPGRSGTRRFAPATKEEGGTPVQSALDDDIPF